MNRTSVVVKCKHVCEGGIRIFRLDSGSLEVLVERDGTIFVGIIVGIDEELRFRAANHVVVEVKFDLVLLRVGQVRRVVQRANQAKPTSDC